MAKILVADDNSNIQKMVGLALKDQGIDVVAVGNGEAAVRKISDVKPDLVLADVFMPVRNGYEVCRYVKEDSALAHIPVILLVGAFDPLDEQEAQRAGADGVLKKPFVPPDPLISMVKSALTRAGIAHGSAAAPEKPATPARSTSEILSGNVGAKVASFPPQKLPEVTPEPVEEFTTPREQFKITAGQEPVAFGSLLETNEEEETPVFSSKPMIEIAKAKNWDDETQDVPEEEENEEEDSGNGAWRSSSLDDEVEHAAKATSSEPDWREAAFHGNPPAKRNGAEPRTASREKSDVVEAAQTRAVAVTTLESKPSDAALPFSGDAWAAAMAAGVEEKLVQQAEPVRSSEETVPEVPATLPDALPGGVAASPADQVTQETAPVEESRAVPANWAPVPESSWEAEAKRASMLAATWDAPPAPVSPEETQEVSAYSSEQPEVHSSVHVEAAPSAYSGHYEPPSDDAAPPELPVIDTSAEVTVEAPTSSHWAAAWEAPKPVEAIEPPAAQSREAAEEHFQPAAQPNMDELVARVLGKMSPEVLQRVTREILKPVIEAIVREELHSRKS